MSKILFKYSLAASALMMGTLMPVFLSAIPAEAVDVNEGEELCCMNVGGQGKAFFSQGPRLIRSAATFKSRSNTAAKYQFTIRVPENAGQALGAVRIQQKENINTVVFNQNKSSAFDGDSFAGGPAVSLAAIGGGDFEPGEATVVFDPPIDPGNTVTVSLKPKRNPSRGGVYLFGVTAYPAGENSQGMYLGSGRIHIYD